MASPQPPVVAKRQSAQSLKDEVDLMSATTASVESPTMTSGPPQPDLKASRPYRIVLKPGIGDIWADRGYNYTNLMMSYAVEGGHPLIPLWPDIRLRILKVLNDSGLPWVALGGFHRRQTDEQIEEDTAIVVTAKKTSDNLWLLVEGQIYHACVISGHPQLKVEMIDGTVSRQTSYEQLPSPGSCISVAGLTWSSGTLGGYFRIVNAEGQEKICALTCHHVVRPLRQQEDEAFEISEEYAENFPLKLPAYDQRLDTLGLRHPAVSSSFEPYPDLEMSVPSSIKKAEDTPQLMGYIRVNRATIATRQADIDNGDTSSYKVRRLEEQKLRLATFQQSLKQKSSFDASFGSVFATSGLSTGPDNSTLDWALVEVKKSRVGINSIPEQPHPYQDFCTLFPGYPIEEFGELKPDMPLMKLGQKTGFTYGRYSCIKSDVKLDGPEGRMTTEHAICPFRLKFGVFSETGDSGAWVFDRRARPVGMVIGGEGSGVAGYMTAMSDVRESIEEATGYRVSLPDVPWEGWYVGTR